MPAAPYSAFGSSSGVTLHQLYREIRRDPSLSVFEGQQVIGQIKGVTGMPSFAPVSKAMHTGLGGAAGYVISKYFDMSPVGKALSVAIGAGVGRRLYNNFNKPPSTPGWMRIG